MGGIGSGRRGGGPVTSSRHSIDVRRLQRIGLLTPGKAFTRKSTSGSENTASMKLRTDADEITLTLRHKRQDGEWHTKEYHIHLDRTPCTYGGSRAWFRCPAYGCGRRVAILYLGKLDIFTCRHCNKLAYRSQRESAGGRVLRHANNLRKQLGWPPGIVRGHGSKPKGMHWRTYKRLTAQYDVFAGEALGRLNERMGSITQRFATLLGDLNELG